MDEIIKHMLSEAHNALLFAYAPYSKFTVASSIATASGNIYTGVNVENSSYGLAICAEASAICKMVSAGERSIQSIVIIAGNNELCSPCGACRQRIFEFSNQNTLIHLCNKDKILRTLSIDDLLPLAFNFKFQDMK